MSGEAGLGVFNIIWISTEVLNQNINPIIFHARLVRPPLKKACCNRTGLSRFQKTVMKRLNSNSNEPFGL